MDPEGKNFQNLISFSSDKCLPVLIPQTNKHCDKQTQLTNNQYASHNFHFMKFWVATNAKYYITSLVEVTITKLSDNVHCVPKKVTPNFKSL